MAEWNEPHLEELVRKMRLKRAPEQGGTPIHLSLYGPSWNSEPLLTKIMQFDTNEWQVLGYSETDRVSVTQYLGSLKCRTDGALSTAARYQQPLSPELTKLLIDAEAFDKETLSFAAVYQQPLPFELAKFLIDAEAFDEETLSCAAQCQRPLTFDLAKLLIGAGCAPAAQDDYGLGWDALVYLASGGHPVDPQVTGLFLSAGCRTNLDGCDRISDRHRLRFDQLLKEHAQWKKDLSRMSTENPLTGTFYGPDWSR